MIKNDVVLLHPKEFGVKDVDALKAFVVLVITICFTIALKEYMERGNVFTILLCHSLILSLGVLLRADRFDVFELSNVCMGLHFIGYVLGLYLILQFDDLGMLPIALPIDIISHQYELAFFPIIGTGSFLCGYLLSAKGKAALPSIFSVPGGKKVKGVVALMVISIAAFYGYLAYISGGFSELAYNLFYVRGISFSYGTGIVQPFQAFGILFMPFVVLFLFYGRFLSAVCSKYLFVFLALGGISLLHNSRGALLTPLTVLVVALYYLGKIRLRTVAVLLLAGAVIILSLSAVLTGLEVDYGISFLGTFDFLQGLAMVVDTFPGSVDFLYGQTIIEGAIYPFFPRVFFPSKEAIYGSDKLWLYAGYDVLEGGTQYSTSQLGDLYAQWGVPAISLGMFIFGVLSRAIYNFFLQRRDSLVAILGYAYFIVIYQGMFRGGVPYIYPLLQSALVLALLIYLSSQKQQWISPDGTRVLRPA